MIANLYNLKSLPRIFAATILAAFATYGLFVAILVLLSADFDPPSDEAATFQNMATEIEVETIELLDVIELQKSHLNNLLSPVASPPLLESKRTPQSARQKSNPVDNNVLHPVRYEFGAPIRASLDIKRLNPTNSDTSIVTDQEATPGFVQCDLEITLGETIHEIEQVVWKDCIGAESSDDAELAAIAWVATAPSSFMNLQPSPGDILAFSYKKAFKPNEGLNAN